LVSKKETYEYFKNKRRGLKHDNPGFAAMAKDLDQAIGETLDLVKELGIQDSTYIFIMSDNGGVQHFAHSASVDSDNEIVETHETAVTWRNLPLRHGKHEYYEGGIRVPFLVLGPGVRANSVSRVPVTGLDLLPTFADLAGHRDPLPENIDGGSFAALLRSGGVGEVRRRREALIFHQGARRVPISAIRKGNYKLVKHWLAEDENARGVKYRGDKLIELYDLSRDLSESRDLSLEMPARAKALHSELTDFLREVGAETEYTKRWDAHKRMKRERGLPSHSEIRLDYRSPFAGR
jgi:arylsulfatase A-like enzyme